MTHGQPISGALATDTRLDLIQRGNAPQRLHGDRRLGLGQIVKTPAHVAPAKGQRYGSFGRLGPSEFLVGLVSIALQDAAVATEQCVGVDMSPSGRVTINHSRWFAATPWAIVSRHRPEVSLFGPSASWIEHRHHGLVGEDPCRGQHHLPQPRHHWGDFGRGISHPERQSGPLDDHALPRQDLRLAIERQVIGIACHQHMGDRRLGRDAALDQPRRRRCLHDNARAGTAGELRTPGHDHPELRRDHVKTLRCVLSDYRHGRPAARARGVLGRQRHFDPRQVCWQCASAGTTPGGIVAAQLGIALLRLRVFFGDRLLKGFQAQLQLFLRQTLGARAEMHASELQQQVTQPVILCQQNVPLGDRRIALDKCCVAIGNCPQHQRPQRFDAFGQALQVVAGRIRHATNPTRQPMV